MENTLAARLEAAQSRRDALTSPSSAQLLDDFEADILAANEALGSALTQIGIALGLPKPTPGCTWGATEALAKARYLLAELEDRRAEQAQLRSELNNAEQGEEWRIWRIQPDGTTTGHGTFYHRPGVDPFLARPDRWIVRRRETRMWRGLWEDVTEHPDVLDYLADCRDNSEQPEHDGDAS